MSVMLSLLVKSIYYNTHKNSDNDVAFVYDDVIVIVQ